MKHTPKNIPYRCLCGEMGADLVCHKCGTPLCDDCRDHSGDVKNKSGEVIAVSFHDYCPNCVSIFGESLA